MAKPSSNGDSWSYTGEFLMACNCDWGCPCNFGQKPTMDFCEGGLAVNITNGLYRTTKLDGLKFAHFAKWPGEIHEGGGTAGIYIDERATRDQRDAMVKIITGKAGGLPWSIFAQTIDNYLEPKFVPFEWEFNGVQSHFKAGPFVHAVLETMRNTVTGAESAAKVVLPNGFVFQEAELTTTTSFAVMDKGMRYAYPGKYAGFTTVTHSS